MAMKSKKAVRESLLNQLRAKGADVDHFEALIDDYMSYFSLVRKMKADIRKNGISYMAVSSVGKEYEKDNPCVKMLPIYTRSMLAILKELGLTTGSVDDGEDEL